VRIWCFLPAIVFLAGSLIAGEQEFRFVVFGDPRSGGINASETFAKMVKEINRENPDLVINTGDAINGYTPLPAVINAMWDEYFKIAKTLKAPCHTAAGNHDIWSPESAAIFTKRVNKLHYSFDHKGCHFVILDEKYDTKWLDQDLARAKGTRHIFVFSHNSGPGSVHGLCRKYGVRAAFMGHRHYYRAGRVLDGVRYYRTAGGGAPLYATKPLGGFYHHLLVTVRGDDIKVDVVKLGGEVVREDIMTDKMANDAEVMQKSLIIPKLKIGEGREIEKNVEIEIVNTLPYALTGEVKWYLPEGCHWTIEPTALQYSLLRGGKKKLSFRLSLKGGAKAAYPVPYYSTALDLTDGTHVLGFARHLEITDVPPPAAKPAAVKAMISLPSITTPAIIFTGKKVSPEVSVEISNPLAKKADGRIEWQVAAGCGWTILPMEKSFSIKPGETIKMSFKANHDGSHRGFVHVPWSRVSVSATGKKWTTRCWLNLAASYEYVVDQRPLSLECERVKTAPKMDGQLNDPCWQTAQEATPFMRLPGDGFAQEQTIVKAAYDENNLYLGILVHESRMDKIIAIMKDIGAEIPFQVPSQNYRSWSINKDDSIEIFLDPDPSALGQYQLMVNSLGAKFESRNTDGTVDFPWRAAAVRSSDSWSLEILVPFTSLGRKPPRSGETWGVNFCRNRKPKPKVYSAWSCPFAGFHSANRFGRMVFK